MIQLHPHAKINLCLEVLGRRPDGYHEVSTILHAIDWTDDLSVEAGQGVTLSCTEPSLANDDNLVVRAAYLLQRETGTQQGAHIHLRKGIPAGAGLGGGSSDAAATLLALNTLWGLDVPISKLLELAAELGSDVPFFLHGDVALAEGRGERVTPLPSLRGTWVVLLAPPITLEEKTRTLFARLRPDHFTDGAMTRQWVGALREERTWDQMPSLFNIFEQVAYDAFPGLEEYRWAMESAGGTTAHLAGAGPTLFSLFQQEREAQEVAGRLAGSHGRVRVARMVG